ncbi:MAG TPA: nuclear transport factor 2 family protein [Fimbriimonadaceae bacterium]|nr:nuclear transport factor 2 family protein [Fimbriimonadaceae bacterium]HRJ96164.1 nuclear transport factor 2 family protein [Fimbriimonadaceae bacterium]
MHDELLGLTRRLLDAIAGGDWDIYVAFTDANLTCFEPEACGLLVEGLDIHRFYFELPRSDVRKVDHMVHARVVPLGPDAAIVAYVRLVQLPTETRHFEETRVWRRTGGVWRQVHVHRSVH